MTQAQEAPDPRQSLPTFEQRYASPVKIKQAYQMAKTLTLPINERILKVITANPGITVTGIMIEMRKTYKVSKQHDTYSTLIGDLVKYGVVTRQKKGKWTTHFTNQTRVRQINYALSRFFLIASDL